MVSNLKQIKTLFQPYNLGSLQLKNRIIMASLTRCKCGENGIPNKIVAKYYSQRASSGLIITECSPINPIASSFPGAGGIYSEEQVQGWSEVCKGVHKNNGKIFLQIWHAGRAVKKNPVGASPIPIKFINNKGLIIEKETPKELSISEIKEIINQFGKGAENAKKAGFDGIELHGANGYLVDQFIRDGTNQRNDEYGGSVENRSRFCLEVIDKLIDVFGADRVGIKLSPVGRFQNMFDSDPISTYNYLIGKLDEKKIAYIQLMEPTEAFGEKKHIYPNGELQIKNVAKQFRSLFKGTLMLNNHFTPESAEESINNGYGDIVSFGRLFIPNPDLVERIKNGWPFSKIEAEGEGEKGYSDYPFYSEGKF